MKGAPCACLDASRPLVRSGRHPHRGPCLGPGLLHSPSAGSAAPQLRRLRPAGEEGTCHSLSGPVRQPEDAGSSHSFLRLRIWGPSHPAHARNSSRAPPSWGPLARQWVAGLPLARPTTHTPHPVSPHPRRGSSTGVPPAWGSSCRFHLTEEFRSEGRGGKGTKTRKGQRSTPAHSCCR